MSDPFWRGWLIGLMGGIVGSTITTVLIARHG